MKRGNRSLVRTLMNLGHALERAAVLAPAMVTALGNAHIMLTASGAMGFTLVENAAALAAQRYAHARAVAAGALAAAAQVAFRMIIGIPNLALQPLRNLLFR